MRSCADWILTPIRQTKGNALCWVPVVLESIHQGNQRDSDVRKTEKLWGSGKVYFSFPSRVTEDPEIFQGAIGGAIGNIDQCGPQGFQPDQY